MPRSAASICSASIMSKLLTGGSLPSCGQAHRPRGFGPPASNPAAPRPQFLYPWFARCARSMVGLCLCLGRRFAGLRCRSPLEDRSRLVDVVVRDAVPVDGHAEVVRIGERALDASLVGAGNEFEGDELTDGAAEVIRRAQRPLESGARHL